MEQRNRELDCLTNIEHAFRVAKQRACSPPAKAIASLLPHEKSLWKSNMLENITHARSSVAWFEASLTQVHLQKPNHNQDEPEEETQGSEFLSSDWQQGSKTEMVETQPHALNKALQNGCAMSTVYRPMGDKEIVYLVSNHELPSTQPYQAIIESGAGFLYSCKYLQGTKKVDTHPSTVVEFLVETALLDQLKARQCKAEDGVMSMGLGDKAGKGITEFNNRLKDRYITFRIVKVKRVAKKK